MDEAPLCLFFSHVVKMKSDPTHWPGFLEVHKHYLEPIIWIRGALFNDGISTGDIARRLLLPRATVYRVVQQLKDRGHVLELKKSGRPRTVNTRRTRGIIKKRITRNDAVSMNQMASSLGISRQSVQSILKKDLGLNSYRLLRGQYLTEQSKKNRLEKAKKLLDALKVRRLSEVIWTDEKIFTVEPLPNRQNARQLLSKDEAKSPKRRLAYKRLFPKSVMVWAGLTSEGHVARFLARSESTRLFRLGIFGGKGDGSIAPKCGFTLLKAWDDLDDDYLRRTVASVPARLKACIKAEVSNFEYLL
ncbi:Protein CBG08665 [Caenorhabditis briggsae]|uniref:Protein CBG08665 n=1 Tax=Caenorhabditis briggsae TaxID=6238 RepID=A8X6V3_CAEBR|nr:Protein CBG08665 [Caenorhabditis briggsae]CAP28364.1 Protein CBG08665 [Caenorhabditis briggsae]